MDLVGVFECLPFFTESEVFTVSDSPDYTENDTYVSPIDQLVEDLRFTSSIGLTTIAVWYIKPKVKS